MAKIIPPFIAPDDVEDDGKWLRFIDGRIQADTEPTFAPVTMEIIGGMGGIIATTLAPARFYNDTGRSLVIANMRAAVGTAPTGATIICQVRLNGAANTQLAIPINDTTSPVAAGPITLTDGSYLDVAVTQVGSVIAGADLVVSARVSY